MAYQVWSVVFGEQPSASKWNILGTNDAGFNDGTAIGDDAIITRHIADEAVLGEQLGIPIAFSAYQSSAQAITTATPTKINLQSEEYDTGSDFDSATNYRFVAPYDGIYHFAGAIGIGSPASGVLLQAYLYKNGSSWKEGNLWSTASTNSNRVQITASVQLTAGDYIELWGYHASGSNRNTVSGQISTWFMGFLVGRT